MGGRVGLSTESRLEVESATTCVARRDAPLTDAITMGAEGCACWGSESDRTPLSEEAKDEEEDEEEEDNGLSTGERLSIALLEEDAGALESEEAGADEETVKGRGCAFASADFAADLTVGAGALSRGGGL